MVLIFFGLFILSPALHAMSLFDTLINSSPLVNAHYFHDGSSHSLTEQLASQDRTQHPLIFKQTFDKLGENRYELTYSVKALRDSVRLRHLEFIMDLPIQGQNMMAEGFQSWSMSKEMDSNSRLSSIPTIVAWKTKFDLQSDSPFYNYSGKPGVIHSNGYTYFRDPEGDVLFLGSVSENTGYTYFQADLNKGHFSIYKDIDGKNLAKGESLSIKIYLDHRKDMSAIWKDYSAYYPKQTKAIHRPLTGWTSWYNTYEKVTEADVLDSLNAIKRHEYPIDLFQIDDGYETAIGDWLDVDSEKFPRGMQILATEIKEAGYMPGLWLAPFAVGVDSKIVKEHQNWIVTDSQGNFLTAGPNWGGFYSIDIYNPEVRGYLQQVFDVALEEWGYEMLKLDFLFAAAMIPRNGKSRGEIMWDAIELIQELTHDRAIILGSGVPLPSAWGRLDYCRISNDASPWWDNSVLRLANVRERVSTRNALVSTLHRWPMQSMFGTDPDVFFIRSENNKLTNDERYTLFSVNVILGQMALMSDNVDTYSDSEHKLYASLFPKAETDIDAVSQISPDVYQLSYHSQHHDYITYVNLSPLPYSFDLPDHHYFEQDNVLLSEQVFWHNPGDKLDLRPHQTRTLLHVKDGFAGSTGHIIPGWEIENWEQSDDGLKVVLRGSRKNENFKLYIHSDQDDLPETIHVNDKETSVERLSLEGDLNIGQVMV
ncbi:glycoside hydrolase superfamily [Phycomyces nitens]|nr:glycoside hydrolase superfamily [Phycomyces nitens]